MLPTVLILTPYFLPGFKGGGPVKSIASIVSLLSEVYQFKILCYNFDLDGCVYENIRENEWVDYSKNVQVFYSAKNEYKTNLNKILTDVDYDVCYLNSFFSFQFSIYPLIKINRDKKIILAPRGEFSPGALSLKSVKKKIFLSLMRLMPIFNKVSRWHATSELERDDIENLLQTYKLARRDQISIAPNLSLNLHDTRELPEKLESYLDSLQGNESLNICFLSRISPKKNLHFVASILKNCRAQINFDFYGPIEDRDYYNYCLSKFAEVASNVVINYKGEVSPVYVSKVISRYDLFLFPTLGENFGHVIAESFSAGTPVLISDQTPWRNLDKKDVGWDLSLNNTDEFSKVIDNYASSNFDIRANKRLRCIEFYEENFNSTSIVESTINLFKF
ncbi:glycosyltransferase family 4 protein [Acinetobacter haemolyticus]|uniref:glycosyltransferase family 4 protein n=1 Tax=Acinetobacter haemolyticus TaxID=29430 RepID=UPI0013723D04|nr:glycosyltransferase family 4 protein [Acinetobacter haemolyticus]NAR98881.1 glycosyltransferase [Acinetobacter haemolyticus]